ncbi:MAG TPA: arginine repressor [Clostridiales bacterium]|nr:arginine repressor [Clostridiales bacterium]HCU56162.1 arginine repressor [Clostridiales bacterium]
MACDNRRLRILELIKKYNIARQEQLVDLLNAEGYNVTQATVSRDINELKLKKIKEDGVFRYVQSARDYTNGDDKTSAIFKQTVHSVNICGNLIVIKTLAGSANAVCAIIDSFNLTGVYGTIAGDDCIFVATDPDHAENIVNRFKAFLSAEKE